MFDVIKKSVLDQFAQGISIADMLWSLGVAFLMGLFILLVYKQTFRGVLFSKGYAFSLVLLAMVTALVIRTISSNLALSLGMVGALSIVRFRTAIKDPLDIAFLFWSIAAGIVLAAGLIPLALVGSLFIGLVLIVFVNRKSHFNPYILVLSLDGGDSEKAAAEFIKQNCKKFAVKSKTVTKGKIELNAEIRLKDESTDFVNALSEMPGVENAALVSYNGDYMG